MRRDHCNVVQRNPARDGVNEWLGPENRDPSGIFWTGSPGMHRNRLPCRVCSRIPHATVFVEVFMTCEPGDYRLFDSGSLEELIAKPSRNGLQKRSVLRLSKCRHLTKSVGKAGGLKASAPIKATDLK
jgi:hypothetical protein